MLVQAAFAAPRSPGSHRHLRIALTGRDELHRIHPHLLAPRPVRGIEPTTLLTVNALSFGGASSVPGPRVNSTTGQWAMALSGGLEESGGIAGAI